MLTHLIAASFAAFPLLLAPEPGANPGVRVHERVDQARLMADLAELPAKRSPWRTQEHRDGLRRTEKLLQDKLKDMGYTPQLHEVAFTGGGRRQGGEGEDGGEPWYNIYVDIPGKTKPAEVLIVGAHFDAVPAAPGADDNGTGTVAVLELARILKDVPMERTVRLMFFNLEEVGLVGSTQYVGDMRDRWQGEDAAETIVGMISLDMLGYFSDEPGSQTWPPLPVRIPLPDVADFIAVGGVMQHQPFSRPLIEAMRIGAGDDVKVFAGDILPIAVPDFLRSDHAPFLSSGIPAVLISDTANFRSPHYHRPSDTIETIDAKRFTAVVRGLAHGVYTVAGPMEAAPASPPTPRRPARPRTPEPQTPPEPRPSTDPAAPRSPVAPKPSGPGLGPQPGQGPEQPRTP